MNAIKNYFITLWSILFEAGKFGFKNFPSMLLIWFLIIIQLALGIPIMNYVFSTEFSAMKPLEITLLVCGLVVYFLFLFLMFKKVFDLASKALEKEKISNTRVAISLVLLGIVNCVPAIFVGLCLLIANFFEQLIMPLQIVAIFFTYVFYLSTSLSLASIVNWQENIVVCAILKAIKSFFSTIKYSMIVFIFMFGLAFLVSYILNTIIYAIALYYNLLDAALLNSIQTTVNVYCLYIFASFYIGAQAEILKHLNKKETVTLELQEQESSEQTNEQI